MASRAIVVLTDDIDGGNAVETVTFGLDANSYEIDLSAKNAKGLRGALKSYVAVAHRSGGRGGLRPTDRRASSRPDPAAVRAWAASHNIKVSARGRISAAVLAQYAEAGD